MQRAIEPSALALMASPLIVLNVLGPVGNLVGSILCHLFCVWLFCQRVVDWLDVVSGRKGRR